MLGCEDPEAGNAMTRGVRMVDDACGSGTCVGEVLWGCAGELGCSGCCWRGKDLI